MSAEPGWCSVCGLPVPAGERFCRWPSGARAVDGQHDDEVVPWASHSLAFMTELVELQRWRCPWCGDDLPDSPRGTAIDHIIPRVYGGPHRRWNLQLLHQECNSAKGKKITAEALELADAHGVTISVDIGRYHAGVRRRATPASQRGSARLVAEGLVEQWPGVGQRGRPLRTAWGRCGRACCFFRPGRGLVGCRGFARQRCGCGEEAFDLDVGDTAAVDVGGLAGVEGSDDGRVGGRLVAHPGRALVAP